MMTGRFNLKNKTGSLSFERKGDLALRRFRKAFKREPWATSLLGLLWSALPVTFLALNVGYYIAYRRFADKTLFLYFAVYVLFAGLISIIMRIIMSATRDISKEEAQEDFFQVIGQVPELLSANLNQYFNFLDPVISTRKEAILILQNPDASEEAIAIAVYDITRSNYLAEASRRIEVFRKNGLKARIQFEYRVVRKYLKNILKELKRSDPEGARLLQQRLAGQAPKRLYGMERKAGFLNRIIEADKKDDYLPMSLYDAYEMLRLTFELLSNREISSYYARFVKSKSLAKLHKNFQNELYDYKTSLDKMSYYIYCMVIVLKELDWPTKEKIVLKIDNLANLKQINKIIPAIINDIENLAEKKNFPHFIQSVLKRSSLSSSVALIISIYEKIIKMQLKLKKQNTHLHHLLAQFFGERDSCVQLKFFEITAKNQVNRIKIDELSCRLTVNQQLTIAVELNKKLKLYEKLFVSSQFYPYKELAYHCFLLINRYIDLKNPEVQYCIYKSNAPNLRAIEIGASIKGIIGWVHSIIEEVQRYSLPSIIDNLRWLTNVNKAPLTEADIDYIEHNFNVDSDILSRIRPNKHAFHIPPNPYKGLKFKVGLLELKRLLEESHELEMIAELTSVE